MFLFRADLPDTVAAPQAGEAKLVERLLWVFMMSFAFDYRASASRESSGAGIDQLLFLALCISSSLAILWLGRRFLTVRPGAWMILFWGSFISYMMVNSLLQGIIPGRTVRIALPLVFCFFAIANAHIAGCMGIRPSHIVRPVFAAACINVVWRIVFGFLFQGMSVETVRFEVQSPANSWLAAWIACAILLRGRFQWNVILACLVLFLGIFITITRSLIFPVMAASVAAGFCFLLGVQWRIFGWKSLVKRLLPVGVAFTFALLALGAAAVVQPVLLERWNERLFHNAADQNLGSDISYLTRKAEADAFWKILSADPIHFINGKGIGSTYYWDAAYLPEIWKVIAKQDMESDGIWAAGHSVWTYSLFSGGVIALCSYLVLLAGTAVFSLTTARANASDPGPDQWLAFLPFVATCCLISETLTANPFQERLTGILFGMMVGLPQAFMVRASWIHASSHPRSRLP
ncbi:MAG: hypothetical protein H8M99_05275 [Gloeobacteraceae cyanobacterium ES-bin-144]|nr:hypothetical protein [Verrucomicrobiales bacterium]